MGQKSPLCPVHQPQLGLSWAHGTGQESSPPSEAAERGSELAGGRGGQSFSPLVRSLRPHVLTVAGPPGLVATSVQDKEARSRRLCPSSAAGALWALLSSPGRIPLLVIDQDRAPWSPSGKSSLIGRHLVTPQQVGLRQEEGRAEWVLSQQLAGPPHPAPFGTPAGPGGGGGVVLEGELRAVGEGVVMRGFASGEERAASPQGRCGCRCEDVVCWALEGREGEEVGWEGSCCSGAADQESRGGKERGQEGIFSHCPEHGTLGTGRAPQGASSRETLLCEGMAPVLPLWGAEAQNSVFRGLQG